MEQETIAEIWGVLNEYISVKEKQEAADHLMPLIVNLELPESDFRALVSGDQYLEEAAAEYIDEDEDDDIDDWG